MMLNITLMECQKNKNQNQFVMKKNILIIGLILFAFCTCKNDDHSNDLVDNEKLSKYQIFNIKDYPINSGGTDIVRCVGIDKDNNVWMGCRPLIKFNGKYWEKFGLEVFGDRVFEVSDITFDSKNTMWCGTNNGLFRFDGKKWESYFYIEERPFQTSVSNVHCDLHDNLWFSKNGDLVCYNGTSWKTFEYQKSFPGAQIQKITSDKNGNVFIGCFDALYKYDGTEFTKIYYSKDDNYMNVRDLDFDKSGDLWISCQFDLLILHQGELKVMDTKSIKNPQYGYYFWWAESLTIDNSNDEVIIGTWNTGIACYSNNSFAYLRGNEFQIDSSNFQINVLEFDLNNNLWIVTRDGNIIAYNEQGLNFDRTRQ